MPSFATLLGAGKQESTLLVLYIPSADRAGKSLGKKEQDRWVRKALQVLGKQMGGATAFPRGLGFGGMMRRAGSWCGTNQC